MSRIRLCSTLIAGAVATAVPAFIAEAQTADAALRAWVSEIDAAPGWSAFFRDAAPGPAGEDLIVRGLTIRSESTGSDAIRVTFDTITVRDYSEPGGGFGAGSLTLDKGRVEAGPITFDLAEVSFEGLELPDFSGITFDADALFTSFMRAYGVAAQANLERGRIGRFDFRQVIEGTTSTATYENFEIGGIENGRIGLISAGPATTEAPSPEGLFRMRVEKIESHGTDLDAVVRVFDPDRYVGGVGDGQWRQAVGLVVYRNLEIEAPGSRISIGQMTGDDLRIRQPAKSFAPLLDRIMANPNMPEAEMEQLMAEYGLSFFSSMAIGHFGFEDLDVTGTGVERVHVGDFYFRDFSIAGLGEFGFGDVEVVGPEPQGTVRLERFAFGNLVFPSEDTIQAAIDSARRGVEPDPLPLIPRLGFLEAVGLDVDVLGQPPVRLDRWRVDLGGYVGPIPTTIVQRLAGLLLPVALIQEAEPRQMLTDLGYDRIAIDYGFDLAWRETDETLSIKDFSVVIKDMGRYVANLDLRGLKRTHLEHPDQLEAALSTLLFVGATMTVEDSSLLGRVLAMQAKKLNITPEQFREQISGALPFFLMMLQNADFQAKIAPALQAFINTPGKLTVTARPTSPVPFTTLIQTAETAPQTLPDLLSIEVTNEPPAAAQ